MTRTRCPAAASAVAEIDRGRGLADPALLVGDGDDARATRDRTRVRLSLSRGEAHGRPACKRRTTPRGSDDALVHRRASLSSVCAPAVNSSAARSPLGNRQIVSGAINGCGQIEQVGRAAPARARSRHRPDAAAPPRCGTARIVTVAAVTRAASRRKAALRESASTSSTPGTPRIASTRPGNPAPLPRSIRLCAPFGTSGCSCAESRICRRHRSASVSRPTRLMRADHCGQQLGIGFEPRQCFT